MKITIKTIGGAEFAITEIEQVDFEMDNGDEFEAVEGENDSLWIENTNLRNVHKQLSATASVAGILISLNS